MGCNPSDLIALSDLFECPQDTHHRDAELPIPRTFSHLFEPTKAQKQHPQFQTGHGRANTLASKTIEVTSRMDTMYASVSAPEPSPLTLPAAHTYSRRLGLTRWKITLTTQSATATLRLGCLVCVSWDAAWRVGVPLHGVMP